MYKLIRYNDNYADEFDLEGFKVMTEEDYVAWVAAVQHCFLFDESGDALPKDHTNEFYFGTNEFVMYESAEDYFKSIHVETISSSLGEELIRAFPNCVNYGFGTFIDPSYL